jgi:hypothetical protein
MLNELWLIGYLFRTAKSPSVSPASPPRDSVKHIPEKHQKVHGSNLSVDFASRGTPPSVSFSSSPCVYAKHIPENHQKVHVLHLFVDLASRGTPNSVGQRR